MTKHLIRPGIRIGFSKENKCIILKTKSDDLIYWPHKTTKKSATFIREKVDFLDLVNILAETNGLQAKKIGETSSGYPICEFFDAK